MTMQSAPLVTVKQAAAALGVDKQTLEHRLETGRLKGKKERILAKDVWFIYKSEVEALMSRREERLFDESLGQTDFNPQFDASPLQAGVPLQGGVPLHQATDLPAGTVITATTVASPREFLPDVLRDAHLLRNEDDHELPLKEQFQLSIKLMSEEFSRCMQSSLLHIQDLRDQLRHSEEKLLLLSDLEGRAAEDRQLVEDKDAALAVAHARIESLQADVERLSRPWWKKLLG
jgi:hypothetical protein